MSQGSPSCWSGSVMEEIHPDLQPITQDYGDISQVQQPFPSLDFSSPSEYLWFLDQDYLSHANEIGPNVPEHENYGPPRIFENDATSKAFQIDSGNFQRFVGDCQTEVGVGSLPSQQIADRMSPVVRPHQTEYIPSTRDVTANCGVAQWLSICSVPGIAWVCQRTGTNDFAGIAEGLKASWIEHMNLKITTLGSRSPEPEPRLAWEYCNAYFERSLDNLFGAVYRPEFERDLRVHLSGKMRFHDPAMYALRNVVYATGCILFRSQSPAADFQEMQTEAWGYFANSLSVHKELLLTKPTMRSVRALLAMTLFAQGVASPRLSSGLISNTALLAQSLGLHRKPNEDGTPMDVDSLQQTWLFWAVYCCEKHIAQQFGRPSVINDDDISCEIPATVHPGSDIDLEIMTYIVQSNKLYDRISKQLLSTSALHEAPAEMLEMLTRFDTELQSWRKSLPGRFQPPDFLKALKAPETNHSLGQMLIFCSYYDLVMITHSSLMYPWIVNSSADGSGEEISQMIEAQTTTSSRMVAASARSLIVIARNTDITRAGTQSFFLDYPMHAFINLFIFLLQNPTLPSASADLALLDVAAGHFGHLDFVTDSKLSFPVAREIAALARSVVEAAKSNRPDGFMDTV